MSRPKPKSAGNQKPHKSGVGRSQPTRTDLSQDIMGRNSLRANDQSNVRNERQAQRDARQHADSPVESFEKVDKDVRAKRDLGKGNRGSTKAPAEE